MREPVTGTRHALAGVAVLAACACNVSSGLARLAGSYGLSLPTYGLQPGFAAAGALLVLFGLWQRARVAALIALAGLFLLGIGEVVVPPMSFAEDAHLTSRQLLGLVAYIFAGGLLVLAFLRAYPASNKAAGLTAMSGAALATGCNCCLVTMGVAGLLHALLPSQSWLMQTVTLYALAAVLMGLGLFRLGGALPAWAAIAGQAMVFVGLMLRIPTLMVNGVRADFVVKYPLIVLGTVTVVGAFALAYRVGAVTSRVAEAAALGPAGSD